VLLSSRRDLTANRAVPDLQCQTRSVQRVDVWRGSYAHPGPLFGPLPGVRDGNALAYEFELPEQYIPRPGRSRLDRVFVLLDVGVQIVQPCWDWKMNDRGELSPGLDGGLGVHTTWYVDLLEVIDEGESMIVRDLYVDVLVPMDGRHQRMLDLEEFADAIEDGNVPIDLALDGLRRWQSFLDTYLHAERDAPESWTDFPPQALRDLMELPSPLGPVVTAP
jgi:hypothetical protein